MIYISESQNLQMYNKINKTYFERFWGIRLEEIKRIKHWAQIWHIECIQYILFFPWSYAYSLTAQCFTSWTLKYIKTTQGYCVD